MPKYRKKPVVIEANQYTEYGKLVRGMCNSQSCYNAGNNKPHVHTIHFGQLVNLEVGDFVIPEADGVHFYPCKADVFAATYETMDTLDLDALNPGIRRVVRLLRGLGFDTCDSGDGATHEHECDQEGPYVHIVTPKETMAAEADRLVAELTRLRIDVAMEDAEGVPIAGVQASYVPFGPATISLFGIADADLPADLCRVCDKTPAEHSRQYNCTEPHPSNVEATCPGCGATFITADPIDPAARCRSCVG